MGKSMKNEDAKSTNYVLGDALLRVDPASLKCVDKLLTQPDGMDGWLRYVYRAINEKLSWMGEPRLDLQKMPDLQKDPTGDFKAPHIPGATFDLGNARLPVMLFGFGQVINAGLKLQMSPAEFIHDALKQYAAMPYGMGVD